MFSPSPNSKPTWKAAIFPRPPKTQPRNVKRSILKHWVTEHAQVVLPYFLDAAVESYVQVCEVSLLLSRHALYSRPSVNVIIRASRFQSQQSHRCNTEKKSKLENGMDALSSLVHLATPEPAWEAAYYHDIIVPDELKLVVSEASEHVKIVEKTGIVTGERKAMIENRKSKIETDKDVMSVWEEYKRKGERGVF
ncbi:uncharacterized protein EAF02_009423 [Botrytis sinoallii]|uniref:uncharacterized protein n=1 Tax=Botrytis sinoallii TaxID=1463999 RepID=UPI0018FF4CE9|nr:uncharacterized protein EAF02_009423 [Botrytis sinoallii]KAF7870233.1 hypothetical protein EAF02_009423 [Botrytis sinoallii]